MFRIGVSGLRKPPPVDQPSGEPEQVKKPDDKHSENKNPPSELHEKT